MIPPLRRCLRVIITNCALVGLLAVTASPIAVAQGTWQRSTKRDEMTDITIFTLVTRSVMPIRSPAGSATYPTLIIRCHSEPEATPEVYLNTSRVIDEEMLVLRWDQQPPDTTGLWTYSRDYSALFADYPIKVLLDLATHRQLLVRYFPFAEGSPQTVKFVLASLRPYAADINRYCGLELGPMIEEYNARATKERATDAQRSAAERKAALAERAAWDSATAKVLLVPSVPNDTTLLVNQPLAVRQYILRVTSNSGSPKARYSVGSSVENGARYFRVDGDTLRIDTPGKWMVTFQADGVSADHTLNVVVSDSTR